MTGVEARHRYRFSHFSISFTVLKSASFSNPGMAGLWLLNPVWFVTSQAGLLRSRHITGERWALPGQWPPDFGTPLWRKSWLAWPGKVKTLSVSPQTCVFPQLCGGHVTYLMVYRSWVQADGYPCFPTERQRSQCHLQWWLVSPITLG